MSKIKIFALKTVLKIGFDFLIFDFNDANLLRESFEFRLVGRYIGSILNAANQSTAPQTPLRLVDEEVGVLLENFADKIELYKSEHFTETNKALKNDENLTQIKSNYEKYLEEFLSKQNENYQAARNQQMISMREKILKGKRKKLLNQLRNLEIKLSKDVNFKEKFEEEKLKLNEELNNLELNFELELKKLDEKKNEKILITKENANTEIFMCTPEFYNCLFKKDKITQSETHLFLEQLNHSCKFKVFKYFWSNGFYLTCGAKFGGDYLIYPGQPDKYHSQFIVVCLDEAERKPLSLKTLITYARMATSVKKTMVLAYFTHGSNMTKPSFKIQLNDAQQQTELNLISINWSHL